MQRLAWLVLAALTLPACGEPPENAAGSAAENASTANDGAVADAADASEQESASADAAGAAPETADVPIKGEASRPAGPPPPEEADACGASRYQWLVGRPRSAIPAEPDGASWRIACTGCPITMDYSPRRMNIFYDSETERIDEVRCG